MTHPYLSARDTPPPPPLPPVISLWSHWFLIVFFIFFFKGVYNRNPQQVFSVNGGLSAETEVCQAQFLISGLECFANLVSDGSIFCSTLLPYLRLSCQDDEPIRYLWHVCTTRVLLHLFGSSPAPPTSCCDHLPTFFFSWGLFFWFSFHPIYRWPGALWWPSANTHTQRDGMATEVAQRWMKRSCMIFFFLPSCLSDWLSTCWTYSIEHLAPLSPPTWASNFRRSVNSQDVLELSSLKMENRRRNPFGTLCSWRVRTSNETEMEYGSGGRQVALGQRLNVCYVTPASASVVFPARRYGFFFFLSCWTLLRNSGSIIFHMIFIFSLYTVAS